MPVRCGCARVLQARQDGSESVGRLLRGDMRDAYQADAAARTRAAIVSDAPYLERLVQFWSNHFTASAIKPVILGVVGPYEAEAIRPHVTGRFVDMLKAVTRHPAMLAYLDNVTSIGPNSRAGRRRDAGLNENLAREVLELHTLGVDGGYTQDDVRAFAAMLTGWSIARLRDRSPGTFRFHPAAHEPGDKVLLGVRYPEAGEAEAEAALDALARHPSTARHVATKLVRHFVADETAGPGGGAYRQCLPLLRRRSAPCVGGVGRAAGGLDGAAAQGPHPPTTW